MIHRRSLWLLAITGLLAASAGYALTSSLWWSIVVSLQAIGCAALARGLASAGREGATNQRVIGDLRSAAPDLSKASFDSGKVAEQAHKPAAETQAAVDLITVAYDSAAIAFDAVDSAVQAAQQTQAAARGYAEVLRSVEGTSRR